jgi:hypothetical protein
MQRALQFQVRRSQHAVEELDELKSELREVDVTKNTLLSLSPYIDARGILRSKTRLVVDYHGLPAAIQQDIQFAAVLNKSKGGGGER